SGQSKCRTGHARGSLSRIQVSSKTYCRRCEQRSGDRRRVREPRQTGGECSRDRRRCAVRESSRSDREAHDSSKVACHLQFAGICQGRWPYELWPRPSRGLSASWRLCEPHSEGREASKPASGSTNKIRVGDQPQDCEDTRLDDPGIIPIARRRGYRMKRRAFIAGLGGAAAWPIAARGQQAAMPVIGFMSARSPEDSGPVLQAFLKGLAEAGFQNGQNVLIEYRWARGDYSRLSAFAAEFVQRRVNVLVATGGESSAVAAKQATTTLPIVFVTGDPVKASLVESLNRPGGN